MRNLTICKAATTLLILFSCLVFGTNINAQHNPYNEVSIASPNAASLGKYADIPVNNHTGIPNISIPIYTIKEGTLQLPISLSYHAGGLKVMEPASWVGAGWSLNAGGVITRTVMGAPDERSTSNVYEQSHGHFSDYGYSNYLFIPLVGDGETTHPDGIQQDWNRIAAGKKDGEPDLFFYNFGTYTGKFYFRDDRTPVFVPEQDIKVDYVYTGSGSIQSFILTTPDGVRHCFGVTTSTTDVDPVERTNPVMDGLGLTIGTSISSWYLNKIESPDGLHAIVLNYAAENYAFNTLSVFPVSGTTETDGDNSNDNAYNLIKNLVKGVRLNSITFSNGSVNFGAGTLRQDLGDDSYPYPSPDFMTDEARSLGHIQINNNDKPVKKYTFSYGYFEDNINPLRGYFASANITTDKKRLRLNSIQESSYDGSANVPPYLFDYFTELVPRRLSFGQDHWGFYNGITDNNGLIPTYTVKTDAEVLQVSGANRDPAWPAMRGGTLKKISYPTGGSAEFDFEPHRTYISYPSNQLVYQGGLTIGYSAPTTYPHEKRMNMTLSAGSYELVVSSSSGGGLAAMSIMGTNHGVSANPGEIKKKIITLNQGGTYTIALVKECTASGVGATASIYSLTGGFTSENAMVGGLRIKSVISNDRVLNKVVGYTYKDATGNSSGILYSRPVYVQTLRNDIQRDVGWHAHPTCSTNGCVTCDGGGIFYYKSPSSIRPLGTTQGNHIGYNEVKVSQAGNGYSIYRYYGSDIWDTDHRDVAVRVVKTDVCEAATPNFPAAPPPFEYKRGELKYEGHFDESNRIRKEISYYPVFVNSDIATPALIVQYSPFRPEPRWGGINMPPANLATFYELTTAKKTQLQTVETTYGLNNTQKTTVANTQYFESAFHAQPTRQVVSTSTGLLESKYKYPSDFRVANCDAISDCYSAYTTAMSNAQSLYLSAISACTNHTCLFNEWYRLIKRRSEARIAYVNCRKVYLNPSNPASFAACLASAKSSAGTELKPVLELVERNMVVPIEVTQWRNGKLIKADFNRYDFVSNPAGMVYLNKMQQINLRTPSTTFTASTVSGSTLTKDSRFSDEVSTKFDKGNLVEVVKKDGVATTYIWGYNNTYPVAKLTGVTYSAVNAMSTPLNQAILQNPSSDNALRTELNRLRTAFPSDLVTTYTYAPLIGMTSETDVNNFTTFYQYDGLGRLSLVRDRNNNILKKFCYNYHGQVENCEALTIAAAMQPTSSSSQMAVYTIYARLEVTNPQNSGTSTSGSGYIRFYSDEACTIPVSVSGLTVAYRRTIESKTCSSQAAPISTGTNYSVVCSGSQHSLGTLELSSQSGTTCSTSSYAVTAGSGYTGVTQ